MEKYSELIHEDETLEDLGLKGLMLLQKKSGFRFGTDAVLLSYFTQLKSRERVIDLCTGSGIIPILFAGKSKAQEIIGVELQEKYAAMAKRSVALNHLDDRVAIHCADVRDTAYLGGLGIFDVVTCNPPYKEKGRGIVNPEDELMIARHEVTIDLPAVIKAAALLLKDHGRVCLVHRPERLLDIYRIMREHGIELKRARMVAPSAGKAPNMILVEGVKGQKPYLKWEPQLEVYEKDGTHTQEIKEIYNDGRH